MLRFQFDRSKILSLLPLLIIFYLLGFKAKFGNCTDGLPTAPHQVFSIPLQYAALEPHNNTKQSKKIGTSLGGRPGLGYYISVNIGTPEQMMSVLVDTGSSNFAIASSPHPFITKHFKPNESRTFVGKDVYVEVPYTQGRWKGVLGRDVLSLVDAPQLKIRLDVACINQSDKFFINGSNWQGILGLAYAAIERPDSSVIPFMDAIVDQTHIGNIFSLQLCSPRGGRAGTLTLGGIDEQLIRTPIFYTPLWREWYYEVVLTRISVGDKPIDIDCKELNRDKTIVDSGTTNLRLPTKVFEQLIWLMKKNDRMIPEEFWTGEKSICVLTGSTVLSFPPITLYFAHTENSSLGIVLSQERYLRKVEEYDSNGMSRTCFKFAISPSESGTVLGAVVMEGFYLVFDRLNRRVGFAESTCIDDGGDEASPSHSRIIPPAFVPGSASECSIPRIFYSENRVLQVLTYAVSCLSVFFLIVIVALVAHWFACRKRIQLMVDADADNLISSPQDQLPEEESA